MIVEYHRPPTIDQALELLSRPNPRSYPLGGGSALSRKKDGDFAVVDLQSLGLDAIQAESGRLLIGATVRLQKLIESGMPPAWLKSACQREAGRNLREMTTIAGLMMSANGRSPLAVALLAADVHAFVLPGEKELPFQQILPARSAIRQPWLITRVSLDAGIDVKCEFIARSPVDLPVLGIAVAAWPSGRVRVAVGGFGDASLLAYDGDNPGGVAAAVEASLKGSDDEWASAEYRQSVAPAIVNRLLQGR